MRKGIYIVIILIGFLQIIGFLTGLKSVRSLGVLSASSPLPIVFTEVKGVETFASDFYLRWQGEDGNVLEIPVGPELYSKFQGPYNRRNIYGAAIAYGPVLPKKLWSAVLSYGLCEDILSEELGIPVSKNNFSVFIKTRTTGRTNQWNLEVTCKQ